MCRAFLPDMEYNLDMSKHRYSLPILTYSLGWLIISAGFIYSCFLGLVYLPNWFIAQPQKHSLALKQTKSASVLSATAELNDGRSEIIANFLERYNSPLKPYAHFGQVFVDISDRYSFDFRLLPAIAMQESNLCKTAPEGTFNCLGFGIHKRGTLAFPSYEANFERAGKELKANYINIGLTTPEQIMRKYTPSSNGSWADSVNQWMAEMRYDDKQAGRDNETDANVMEFAK